MWKRIKEIFAKIFDIQGENVDYIGGGEALPEPLDQEEEKLLVGKYMQGDATAKKQVD